MKTHQRPISSSSEARAGAGADFASGPRHAPCPRCGYDQRGAVSTWTDSCPVRGICTECGLAFEWRELLNPRHSVPRWCVEYLPARFVTPRRVLLTLIRSAWPPALWRNLEMSHPCRWLRIMSSLAMLATLLYLLFAATNGVVAGWSHRTATARSGWTSNTSPWTAGTRAALAPLSRSPAGRLRTPRGFTSWTVPPARRLLGPGLRVSIGSAMTFVAFAGMVAAFTALPISRRRAKVRWRHIARVGVYGLAVPLLLFATTTFTLMAVHIRTAPVPVGIEFVVFVAWSLAWWLAATREYLRMEHAWAVALSVVTIGVTAWWAVVGVLYLWFRVELPPVF